MDLVTFANHKNGSVWIRGNEVMVRRGQIAWSEVTMAARWTWSRNKVRRFLKWLETEQQIEQQKDRYITSITTILNYDIYQSDTADDTAERQQKDSRRYINKNVKNVKNVKKEREVANAPTPAQQMREFVESTKQQEQAAKLLESKGVCNSLEEIQKFVLYWTEPTKSGKKQRWETQKTFEVRRRLVTWMNKSQDFRPRKKTIQSVI